MFFGTKRLVLSSTCTGKSCQRCGLQKVDRLNHSVKGLHLVGASELRRRKFERKGLDENRIHSKRIDVNVTFYIIVSPKKNKEKK